MKTFILMLIVLSINNILSTENDVKQQTEVASDTAGQTTEQSTGGVVSETSEVQTGNTNESVADVTSTNETEQIKTTDNSSVTNSNVTTITTSANSDSVQATSEQPATETKNDEVKTVDSDPKKTETEQSKEKSVERKTSLVEPIKPIPTAPEQPKTEQNKEVTERKDIASPQDAMATINSLDVEEEGNWLLKRVWWEQGEQTFEKIINLNDEIIKIQVDYLAKKNELDKKLGDVFRKIGFEEGELIEILEYFLNELNKERNESGLDQKRREFYNLLNQKKLNIEQLKKDLEELGKLDVSVNDVINQLVDQINKSREYEKSAWQDFKEIGRVLNDKKAKVLSYQIEASLKSIQSIQNYLQNDLQKYFTDLIDSSDKTSNAIMLKVSEIEQEIGSLKDQYETMQREEALRKRNEIENKQKIDQGDKKENKKKSKNWIESSVDYIKSFF